MKYKAGDKLGVFTIEEDTGLPDDPDFRWLFTGWQVEDVVLLNEDVEFRGFVMSPEVRDYILSLEVLR